MNYVVRLVGSWDIPVVLLLEGRMTRESEMEGSPPSAVARLQGELPIRTRALQLVRNSWAAAIARFVAVLGEG